MEFKEAKKMSMKSVYLVQGFVGLIVVASMICGVLIAQFLVTRVRESYFYQSIN